MNKYRYLIVGGGMSAAAAIKGIREVDAEGSIGLVSTESDPPYKRPPLSKKLWQGKPLESVWKGMSTEGVAAVELHLGHTVVSMRPREHCAVDETGTTYQYEKLLLATGGSPRRLTFGGDDVIYYRTLQDFRKLKGLAETRDRFAVIGGGFIGAEVAAALAMNGKQVTMVVPGHGIGERMYPPDVVRYLNMYYRQRGVDLVIADRVTGLDRVQDAMQLRLESGRDVRVEGVVAGIGIEPNTTLATEGGLQVQNGIVVDEHLRTSDADIFAAGDVALYRDCVLGESRRVEHEDNALAMGRAAGRAMAGSNDIYDYLPFFYSDMFDLGYEAVGEIDSRLDMVPDWKEPYKEGVIYYLKDGLLRGVLLWNVWGQVEAARRLIAEGRTYKASELKGLLPEVSAQ